MPVGSTRLLTEVDCHCVRFVNLQWHHFFSQAPKIEAFAL